MSDYDFMDLVLFIFFTVPEQTGDKGRVCERKDSVVLIRIWPVFGPELVAEAGHCTETTTYPTPCNFPAYTGPSLWRL